MHGNDALCFINVVFRDVIMYVIVIMIYANVSKTNFHWTIKLKLN